MLSNYFLLIDFVVKDDGTYLGKSWKYISDAMQHGYLCYVVATTKTKTSFNITYSLVESAEFSDNTYSIVLLSTGSAQGGGYFECKTEDGFPKLIPNNP